MNEVQNTFNTMADRPLLITSPWCKFGSHKWQKWSEVRTGKGYNPVHFQYRYCDGCNIYDWRTVTGQVPIQS